MTRIDSSTATPIRRPWRLGIAAGALAVAAGFAVLAVSSSTRERSEREDLDMARETPAPFWIEADHLASRGDHDGAARLLETAVREFPEHLPTKIRLAYLLLATDRPDRYERARAIVESGRELAGLDPEAASQIELALAVVLREEEDFHGAILCLERARALASSAPRGAARASLELVLTRVEEGELELALAAADLVQGTLPPGSDLVERLELWRGIAAVELGRRDLALAVWREARRVYEEPAAGSDPSPAAALAFLVDGPPTAERAATFREAARVESEPTRANNVEFVIGLAHELAGERDLATAAFDRAFAASWGRNFPYFTIRRWRSSRLR